MTPQLHQELSAFLGMTIGIFAEANAHGEPGSSEATGKIFTQSEHLGGMFRREAQRLLTRIQPLVNEPVDTAEAPHESVEVAEI